MANAGTETLTSPQALPGVMRRGLVLVALLLAFPGAHAAPTPVSVSLTSASAVWALGDVRLEADSAVVDLTNETMPGRLTLRWGSAHGYGITMESERVAGTDAGVGVGPGENETLQYGPGEARFDGCTRPCEAALVVLPGSRLVVEGLPEGPLETTAGWTLYRGFREAGADSMRAKAGEGWVDVDLAGATLRAEGRLVLLLNGPVGELDLGDRTQEFWTGERLRPEKSAGGVTMTHTFARRYAALVLEDAELVSAPLQEGRASAPSATVHASGGVEVHDATGLLEYGAVRRRLEGERLVVDGPVGGPLTTAPQAAGPMWRGAFGGEAAGVTVADAVVRPVDPRASATAALASGAAAILLLALLVKAFAWAFYSRLGERDILENANRRAVYDALAAAPGSRPAELSRRTGIHEAVVRYHLRRLRATGLARRHDAPEGGLWFPPGPADAPLDRVVAERAVRGETARRLVDALLQAPQGVTQNEAAAATGISRRLVSYHLQRLEEAALVTRHEGRPARFEATPALRDAVGAAQET